MTQKVVRRIDHLAIAAGDVPGVFEMLRDRLGLVVMTPVTRMPESWFGYPTTAWFNLGNMPLEILEPPHELRPPPGPLEIGGIVFEPVEAAVAELECRGIPHTPPRRYDIPDGLDRPVPEVRSPAARTPQPGSPHGTQFFFQGLVGGNAWVLCYEWAFVPASVMREALRRELDEMPDRPLPVDGVAEVVVGATDVAAERDRWQALLDPVEQDEPGLWRFDDGPALRLVEHDHDAIVGLTLHVLSLELAERYLKERDMLASSSGGELAISPEALDGLRLKLVEGHAC